MTAFFKIQDLTIFKIIHTKTRNSCLRLTVQYPATSMDQNKCELLHKAQKQDLRKREERIHVSALSGNSISPWRRKMEKQVPQTPALQSQSSKCCMDVF